MANRITVSICGDDYTLMAEERVREHGPGQGRQAPVLDNHTVYAAAGGQTQHVRRRCQLPVRGEGVQGQIHSA